MTRLIRDHSAGAAAVDVPCYQCGRMVRMVDTVIDLDGPAFQAYYHPECIPAAWRSFTPKCAGPRDCAHDHAWPEANRPTRNGKSPDRP